MVSMLNSAEDVSNQKEEVFRGLRSSLSRVCFVSAI